jgi:hypothetical protein
VAMIYEISKDFSHENLLKIHAAAVLADQFFESELHVILGKDKFTHTDETPEQVFNKIASNHKDMVIEILPWKPFNRWTAAIATTFKNKPGKVFINVRKINQRSVGDYVNTLCHEALHCAPLNYGHGSNSPKGKENSVNYWLGAQSEEWAKSRT